MPSPLGALKSFTNSGQFGGNAGPSSTGAFSGGGAKTAGIDFGHNGISIWAIVAIVALVVVGWTIKQLV